jgi:hypothetical protein
MERARLPFEDLPEGLGQDVLSRMLLHAVEPGRPVNAAADAPALEAPVEDVEDRPVEVEDLDDSGPAERPRVPRLAAGLRVKGRPVEDDRRPAFVLPRLHDLGLELREIGVFIVEPLRSDIGHRRYLIRAWRRRPRPGRAQSS